MIWSSLHPLLSAPQSCWYSSTYSNTTEPFTQAVVSIWITHQPSASQMVLIFTLPSDLSSGIAFPETISLDSIVCSLTRPLQLFPLIIVAILYLLVELYDPCLSPLPRNTFFCSTLHT